MKKGLSVFMDSDAFVASVKKDDTNHEKVKQIFLALESEPIIFYTSNYVFAESITVISQKINQHAAIEFIKNTKSSQSMITIKWILESVEQLAIEIFAKQTSKNVSFVDCTNMAIMKYHQMDYLFSFDSIYKKNGFKLIEEILTLPFKG